MPSNFLIQSVLTGQMKLKMKWNYESSVKRANALLLIINQKNLKKKSNFLKDVKEL